ncbi:MAG: hypothetical protein LBU90_10360 [Bacteroidales bacterium]|jgi:hypothetical protein|nr:hypothetical protein [Bacteroidales bacterium]
MKEILNAILERLAALPELKYVDENWGQMNIAQSPAKFPMALVDVESVEFSNMGNHVQEGEARITVTIAALRLSNSSSGAPAAQRRSNFEFYDLLTAAHCALHHWRPANHAGLMVRLAQRRIDSADGYKITELTYGVRYRQQGAQQYTQAVNPQLKVEN